VTHNDLIQMRVAASLMAARKLRGALSDRVAMPRNYLSLLKKRSIRPLRRGKSGLAVPFRFAPMLAQAGFSLAKSRKGTGVVGAISKEDRAYAHVLQHRFCHPSRGRLALLPGQD
jgi:hypothetical protein